MIMPISKKSRAARWLRNKWAVNTCGAYRVSDWKLEKYSKTFFAQHCGVQLASEQRAQ